MTTLYGTVNNTLTGAGVGSSYGPWGAAIGAGVGLVGSLFGDNNSGSSAVSYEDQLNAMMFQHYQQRNLMEYQQQLNRQLQADTYNYNRQLAEQQFGYEDYFAKNNMINSYNQLQQLGINPLLMNPNGSSGSVGLGNVGSSAVGLGNTGAFDPASVVSANASSAQARVGKINAFTNLADKLTDIDVKRSTSAKMLQEAETQQSVRDLNESQRALNTKLAEREMIINSQLPERLKAELLNLNSQSLLNTVKAQYEPVRAEAEKTSAEANYINATQGSPTKIVADYLNDLFGRGKGNPIKNTTGAIQKSFGDRFENDYANFYRLYGKYYKE